MQHKDRASLEDAFYTDLYQRHAAGLFAYVYRQTASREDAEDIVLDVFLAVLQQQDFVTFDEQKQVAWLWTITRHKVVDRFRKSARQQRVPIELLAEELYENDEISPEGRHLRREEHAQLHRAIKALPAEQQEVLQLRFGFGLRCAEIAPVLNKSEGAVCMLLYRTIQILRGIYVPADREDRTNQEKGEKQ
jgi:RNA polymerase sigma factor (sigma-70 family)